MVQVSFVDTGLFMTGPWYVTDQLRHGVSAVIPRKYVHRRPGCAWSGRHESVSQGITSFGKGNRDGGWQGTESA